MNVTFGDLVFRIVESKRQYLVRFLQCQSKKDRRLGYLRLSSSGFPYRPEVRIVDELFDQTDGLKNDRSSKDTLLETSSSLA